MTKLLHSAKRKITTSGACVHISLFWCYTATLPAKFVTITVQFNGQKGPQSQYLGGVGADSLQIMSQSKTHASFHIMQPFLEITR
jgi:hypothetical protein